MSLGVSSTNMDDETLDIYGALGGSAKAGRQAAAFANQLYPQVSEADPWEAAFQFFAEMGKAASQPGATGLGAAVSSMGAPLDYLNAKKKEKTDTDRARLQVGLQIAPSLKAPKATGSGTSVMVVDPETGKPRYMSSAEAIRTGAQPYIAPKSGSASIVPKDYVVEAEDGITIAGVLYAKGTKLQLTDTQRSMFGPSDLASPTTDKSSGGAVKYSDDGTGVLRYTENPPEGKSIGDEVFEGIDLSGYTTNQTRLADQLRDDLTRSLADFNDINSSMKDINSFYLEAVDQANPISDYSLAVQYAKIIDPGTAAREGEVAAIAGAGSLSGSLRAGLTNALLGTGKLSQRMRASIFNNSVKIYESKLPAALSTIERYKRVSNDQKEGMFELVGLNINRDDDGRILYKGVGGDPEVDTNNYHILDLNNFEEDPRDLNPMAIAFPEDFSFEGFSRSALVNLLGLPPGALDGPTLDKIEAALGDL